MAEQRGFRVLRDPQEEQDFTRDFVRDPGPIATTRSVEQLNQARSDPVAPLGLQGDTVPVGAFRAAERMQSEREDAAVTEARVQARSRPGLQLADVEEGVPSFRRFEYTPGPGRGLRGQIETATARPGFAERVDESFRAGAYDPVTPQRRLSAQQVQEGRGRALQAMRGLAAARMGVPEQFLDAVRQGQLTGREANILAAQQPVASGRGLSAADILKLQQGERAQGLRERQFAFARQQETNEMLGSDNPVERTRGRRQAAAEWAQNPGDPIARQTMARSVTELINDLGDPGVISYLWFDVLGGSPQGILDPDTRASVQDVLSGQGFSIGYGSRGRGTSPSDGKPVLMYFGNPVDEWEDIQSADPDAARFLLQSMGFPTQQRGLRPR